MIHAKSDPIHLLQIVGSELLGLVAANHGAPIGAWSEYLSRLDIQRRV